MDPLVIFASLFVPVFALSYMAAGRDVILFQTRPKARRSVVLCLTAAAFALLLVAGMPVTWAVALMAPGPVGSSLGDWLGRGGWIVVRYRVTQFLSARWLGT